MHKVCTCTSVHGYNTVRNDNHMYIKCLSMNVIGATEFRIGTTSCPMCQYTYNNNYPFPPWGWGLGMRLYILSSQSWFHTRFTKVVRSRSSLTVEMPLSPTGFDLSTVHVMKRSKTWLLSSIREKFTTAHSSISTLAVNYWCGMVASMHKSLEYH